MIKRQKIIKQQNEINMSVYHTPACMFIDPSSDFINKIDLGGKMLNAEKHRKIISWHLTLSFKNFSVCV